MLILLKEQQEQKVERMCEEYNTMQAILSTIHDERRERLERILTAFEVEMDKESKILEQYHLALCN